MNLGLKQRMLLMVGGVTVVAFVATLLFVGRTAAQRTEELARREAHEMAARYREVTQARLAEGLTTTRALAGAIEGQIAAGATDRKSVAEAMRRGVATNPSFFGIWCMFEADAFDGKDQQFAGQPEQDSTGAVNIYFVKEAGGALKFVLSDIGETRKEPYYQIPFSTGREALIDPYIDPDAKRLMASVCVPIRDAHGKSLGVLGIDLVLEDLRKEISQIRPYETGYALLISNAGVYAAHPDAALLGKPMENAAALTRRIAAGEAFELSGPAPVGDFDALIVYEPVRIGAAAQAWSLAIVVPTDAMLAAVRHMIVVAAGIGTAAVAFLAIVIIVLARRIADPVQRASTGISDGAAEVAGASQHVAAASQQLAASATEEAAGINQASGALNHIAQSAAQTAQRAQQAHDQLHSMGSAVEQSDSQMQQLAAAMDAMAQAGDQTQRVIRTIDEIAFQTNILALNAAV